jgi:hypothetical protein
VKQYELTSPVPSMYHCEPQLSARSSSRHAEVLWGRRMQSAFKAWIGHPVVLQVALGDIKVPLRGMLLKDGSDTVRMRIGDGWDVDIYKTMILAVEEDGMVLLSS